MLKFCGIALCLSVILADVGITLAQGSNQYLPPQEKGYDYKPPIAGFPSAPKPVQTRPPQGPPAQTYGPPATQTQSDHVHEPGMPFDFQYSVKDAPTSNDYNHKAVSDGDVTRGEYRVAMPDGRTQVVRYTADWKNGYNAEVTYEGEASYPDQKSSSQGGFQGY